MSAPIGWCIPEPRVSRRSVRPADAERESLLDSAGVTSAPLSPDLHVSTLENLLIFGEIKCVNYGQFWRRWLR